MNRRDSLKTLGLAVVGGSLLLDGCGPVTNSDKTGKSTPADQLPGVTDVEHQRNVALHNERYFNEHEMLTIGVLADIIIPADNVSGSATDAGVPEFVEFMVKDIPSYQVPLRGGLKWLDLKCLQLFGRTFVECEQAERLEIVDAIAYPDHVAPEMTQGAQFFNLMRNLTASGFYTSELGIKDIGYVGNQPGYWDGVPEDILKEHGFESGWG